MYDHHQHYCVSTLADLDRSDIPLSFHLFSYGTKESEGGLCRVGKPHMSRPDNWQTKFSHICQDIRDIKSNNYSRHSTIQKLSNTSTNSSSTKVLDNRKPPGYDKNGADDPDASDSVYTPLLEKTMGHNSRI